VKIYTGTKNIERKIMGFHGVKDCNGRKKKFMKMKIFLWQSKDESKAQISGASRDCLVQKVNFFVHRERQRQRQRQREPFFLDRIKLLLFLVSCFCFCFFFLHHQCEVATVAKVLRFIID
jgi:hypothetical protein